jgi:hypothetical protein
MNLSIKFIEKALSFNPMGRKNFAQELQYETINRAIFVTDYLTTLSYFYCFFFAELRVIIIQATTSKYLFYICPRKMRHNRMFSRGRFLVEY